jgi:hypothetical protein
MVYEYSAAAYALSEQRRGQVRLLPEGPRIFCADGVWFCQHPGQEPKPYHTDGYDLARSLRRHRLALLAARYGRASFLDERARHYTSEYV